MKTEEKKEIMKVHTELIQMACKVAQKAIVSQKDYWYVVSQIYNNLVRIEMQKFSMMASKKTQEQMIEKALSGPMGKLSKMFGS